MINYVRLLCYYYWGWTIYDYECGNRNVMLFEPMKKYPINMILNRIQLQPLIAIFANVLQTNGHVNLRETSVSFFFCFVFICICKIPCRLSIPLSQSCRFQLASVLQYRKNEEFARFSISQCAFPGRNYQKEIPTRLEVKAFLIWKWQTFNLEMPTVKDYGFADNGTLVQQKNPHLH